MLLVMWLGIIWVLSLVVAPGLSRIAYPQPLDLLVLALAPMGAFHAAGHGGAPLTFTLYGFAASGMFIIILAGKESRHGDLTITIWSCLIMLAVGFASRYAASYRPIWDRRRRFPVGSCQACGYNLTGNVSGTCPECGTPATADQPGNEAN
ncbi:MAG: hypothetical protein AMXMBFR13_23880 [Phycisphaerae bacterium]